MATTVAAIVFLLVGGVHFARLIWHFNVTLGTWQVPLWVNGIGVLAAWGLAVWLWKDRGGRSA